jgi:hypothetical protein
MFLLLPLVSQIHVHIAPVFVFEPYLSPAISHLADLPCRTTVAVHPRPVPFLFLTD